MGSHSRNFQTPLLTLANTLDILYGIYLGGVGSLPNKWE